MPAPQILPAAEGKPAPENAKPSDRSADAFSRQMRLEITRLTIIALFILVASIIFEAGDWLDLILQDQTYHIDDIIAAVIAVSFVLMIFLLRGWQEVRKEAAARAVVVRQMEQRSIINAQLSPVTSLLHACFELGEASAIISHFARQLFPEHTGALYVFRSSQNLLELTTLWGDEEDNEPMFGPRQCWARQSSCGGVMAAMPCTTKET